MGFEAGGRTYVTPFSGEDEIEAVGERMAPSWLRQLDRVAFVPFYRRIFERTCSKRMKTLFMAAWISVRGDLHDPETAAYLEKLVDGSPSFEAAAVHVAGSSPAGLQTLMRFLNGKPTQRVERVPLGGGDDLAGHFAPTATGVAAGQHDTSASRLLPVKHGLNAKLYSHRLSDMLQWFTRLPSLEGTPEILDGFGALLHLSFNTAAYYSNPREVFATPELKEDHDMLHVPLVAVWNALQKRATGVLALSVRALYAVLRPSVLQKIKGERELGYSRQVEFLVLFSVFGSLLPGPVSGVVIPAPANVPSWLFGLEVLTEEAAQYVDGVQRAWKDIGSVPAFRRLVIETQCQLPLLVMRRAKCCYSNCFVFAKE